MTPVSILGIDYSYTCPAVCYSTPTAWSWFVNYRKPGKPYPPLDRVHWSRSTARTEVDRYLELASWVVDIITQTQPTAIVLEDYAFAANGRITQLSENVGVLKALCQMHHPTYPIYVVAPTTMKKFATGRGNATKDDIWAACVRRHPWMKSWARKCHPKATRIGSPVADMADAYFLAAYGWTHYAELSNRTSKST